MFQAIDEQSAVYQSKSKHKLLLAGPGTGKTTVVSCCAIKSANTIEQDGFHWTAPNAKVLVMSLTNYAAERIQNKIVTLIRDENFVRAICPISNSEAVLNSISCNTFHSFSMQMLNFFQTMDSLKKFTVVDNESDEEILQTILDVHQSDWKDNKSVKKVILDIYLKQKLGKSIRKIITKYHERYKNQTKLIVKILKHLDQIKREKNLITFDDMLVRFNSLLKNKCRRERIIKMFPVILVDEFQDTSNIQFKILRKIVGSKTHLLCAGDDGQTIYTWNGASFFRSQHFQKRFPECEIFTLTNNHRSGRQRLTDLSNALIAQSKFATLKPVIANKKGSKPKLICNESPQENYEFIISEIDKLKKKGISLNQIAIIYRFRSDVSDFRNHLMQHRIPHKIYRAKNKRNRPIIRLIFALIRIIESETIQSNSWQRVLSFHTGVGRKWTDKIIKWLKTKKSTETIYPKQYRFTPYLKQLLEFVYSIKCKKLSNQEKLRQIIDYSLRLPKVNPSIDEHIKPTLFKHIIESSSLLEIINKYNDRSYPLFYSFDNETHLSESHLTLSTVHGVKGGEFHTVFYLGTGDYFFEKHRLFKSKRKREGELQALNVAVTRAKRMLYLLFPIDLKTWKGKRTAVNPWRFLRQVDGKLFNIIKSK